MVNFYNYFLNCDNPNCIDWRDCPATAYDVAGIDRYKTDVFSEKIQ